MLRVQRAVEKEGSQAGPIIDFVNAVAETVEKEYPDFLVMTLAYSYTRKAPAHIRPRKNVAVRLCSIECDFSKALASGPRNRDFLRDIEEWSVIAPHLYIWNYVTNFSQFLLPHPNWDGLAPDLRLFVKHQAIGVFEQGDRRSTCGDFQALRPWLLARLLWDPEQDPEALIREFLDGYYGPAGTSLGIHFNHPGSREEGRYRPELFPPNYGGLAGTEGPQPDHRRLDQAALAVAHDARYTRRLNTARMPIDYVWLRRYNALAREAEGERLSFLGPEDPVAARDAFLRKIHLLDCAEFGEGHPFQGAVPGLSRLFMGDHLVPLNYQSLDRDDYVYRLGPQPATHRRSRGGFLGGRSHSHRRLCGPDFRRCRRSPGALLHGPGDARHWPRPRIRRVYGSMRGARGTGLCRGYPRFAAMANCAGNSSELRTCHPTAM